jgi:PAS domain S-box-containing protein
VLCSPGWEGKSIGQSWFGGRSGRLGLLLAAAILLLCLAGVSYWFISSQGQSGPAITGYVPVTLTEQEQQWIAKHPVVRVCPDQNYPPFEFISTSGEYQGISADLLREIAKNTGLQLEVMNEPDWNGCVNHVRSGTADILGAVYISDLRSDYLNYSEPYYRSLLPIITRNIYGTGMTLDQFSGRTVASVEGFTTTLLLKEKYPDIIIKEVPDVRTGLELVSLGAADAYFGDLAASTYYVQEEGMSNLHVAGIYDPARPDDFSYAFGIRKDAPELVSIINKGLHAIPPKTQEEIFHRWVSPTLTYSRFDPVLVLITSAIIAALILISGLFMLWNRTLRRVVDERTRDLTRELADHKKTADRLRITRFTVDHSQSMMIWLDGEGRIRDMNETVCSMTGYPREELLGRSLSVLDPAILMAPGSAVREQLQSEGWIRVEHRIVTRESGEIPVSTIFYSFTYDGTEWLCAEIQDITERKIMEAGREAAISQIQKNLAELSMINDGVRNPLSVILGYAEIYCSEGFENIDTQVQRIDGMIHQLDQRWNESEKIIRYLKKHHGVVLPPRTGSEEITKPDTPHDQKKV